MKPSQTFTWATDTLYTSGPENGLTTRDPPPAPLAAQGWEAGDMPAARHANYLFGVSGDWVNYLDGITTDPDFVGADFDWTGDHGFAGSAFETTNSDVSFAGLRSSANIGLAGATSDLEYTNTLGVTTARTRVMKTPLSSGVPFWAQSGTYGLPAAILTSSTTAWWEILSANTGVGVQFPLPLVSGSVMTKVRVAVHNPTGSTKNFAVRLRRIDFGKVTVDAPVYTDENTPSIPVPAGQQVIVSLTSPSASLHDRTEESWELIWIAAQGLRLYWAETTFGDPGPRNY